MNENILKLERSISECWAEIERGLKTRDRNATQAVLDRISHFENLKQQQQAIDMTIAASLSNGTASKPSQFSQQNDTGPTPRTFSVSGKKRTIRPKEIRFGSYGSAINYANEIPIAVAEWLIKQGKAVPTIHNFIHPSNTGFSQSAQTKKLSNGQFIEVGDNQAVLLQKARRLLDLCGFQGLRIEVLLMDNKTLAA